MLLLHTRSMPSNAPNINLIVWISNVRMAHCSHTWLIANHHTTGGTRWYLWRSFVHKPFGMDVAATEQHHQSIDRAFNFECISNWNTFAYQIMYLLNHYANEQFEIIGHFFPFSLALWYCEFDGMTEIDMRSMHKSLIDRIWCDFFLHANFNVLFSRFALKNSDFIIRTWKSWEEKKCQAPAKTPHISTNK